MESSVSAHESEKFAEVARSINLVCHSDKKIGTFENFCPESYISSGLGRRLAPKDYILSPRQKLSSSVIPSPFGQKLWNAKFRTKNQNFDVFWLRNRGTAGGAMEVVPAARDGAPPGPLGPEPSAAETDATEDSSSSSANSSKIDPRWAEFKLGSSCNLWFGKKAERLLRTKATQPSKCTYVGWKNVTHLCPKIFLLRKSQICDFCWWAPTANRIRSQL